MAGGTFAPAKRSAFVVDNDEHGIGVHRMAEALAGSVRDRFPEACPGSCFSALRGMGDDIFEVTESAMAMWVTDSTACLFIVNVQWPCVKNSLVKKQEPDADDEDNFTDKIFDHAMKLFRAAKAAGEAQGKLVLLTGENVPIFDPEDARVWTRSEREIRHRQEKQRHVVAVMGHPEGAPIFHDAAFLSAGRRRRLLITNGFVVPAPPRVAGRDWADVLDPAAQRPKMVPIPRGGRAGTSPTGHPSPNLTGPANQGVKHQRQCAHRVRSR